MYPAEGEWYLRDGVEVVQLPICGPDGLGSLDDFFWPFGLEVNSITYIFGVNEVSVGNFFEILWFL